MVSKNIPSTMNNRVHAITGAFYQQWKSTAASSISLSFLVGPIPVVAVLAWIALQSKDSTVLTYIMLGGSLFAIWGGIIFRTGWALTTELTGRTLEFTMISRTSIISLLFGKTLAHMVYGIPIGVIAFLTMFIVTRELPQVANVPLLLISLFFILISILIISLLLSPIMVLFGGRAGFFNAIMPLGVVLSGFLFPIDHLPVGLQIPAYMLPTSWAMSGVWQSVAGPESFWAIASCWLLCILTSAVIFVLTYFLFKVVEKRFRITGVLQTY